MVRARSREGKWWRGQSLLVLWVVIVAGFMLLDDIREISGAGYIAPGAGREPWTGPLERLGIDAITVFAGPSRSVAASVSAQSRRGRNPVAFTPSGHHHDEIPRPAAREIGEGGGRTVSAPCRLSPKDAAATLLTALLTMRGRMPKKAVEDWLGAGSATVREGAAPTDAQIFLRSRVLAVDGEAPGVGGTARWTAPLSDHSDSGASRAKRDAAGDRTARWRVEPVIRPFCIDGGRSVWLLFRTTCVSRAVSREPPCCPAWRRLPLPHSFIASSVLLEEFRVEQ